MKEDVLEQVVEDYLQLQGYFTIHNVRFRPSPDHPEFVRRDDSVHSDVDVVGFNPRLAGPKRVMAVSCKSWQTGFDAPGKLAELRGEKANGKRATWRYFRELWVPKWAEAFRAKIKDLTGETTFSYRIACTRLKGDDSAWATDATIVENLGVESTFGFLSLEEMWRDVLNATSTTPAPSEIGRLAQLLKAAGLTKGVQVATPTPSPVAVEAEESGIVA